MAQAYPPQPGIIRFVAGEIGQWKVDSIAPVSGETLDPAPFLMVTTAPTVHPARWALKGAISNLRYTRRHEREVLTGRQSGLGRSEARRAALLPITKTDAWWALAQDERQAIYDRSKHTPIGLDYLPAIARRLHHSRDFGEPFDFLTWFEYAPEHEAAFDALLTRLRATEEWTYVAREVDIRMSWVG